MISFSYLSSTKVLCFGNGGKMTPQPHDGSAMPYAARTTLVSGPGAWGAVTKQVTKVVAFDTKSPKGRVVQLLPVGDDLRVFVEEKSGSLNLRAYDAKGKELYNLTLR
jgi:hypothetical protein